METKRIENFDIANHPCFNKEVRHTYGRIHLPVAPRCNIQCKFCNRNFDCVDESRPGVTSQILSPPQALDYLDKIMEEIPSISVVGIAGPGDPFANPVETLETMRLIRKKYPNMLLCIATNGLNLLPYIEELAALKVSHVTITINAIDESVGSKIYSWLRYKKRLHSSKDEIGILLNNQIEAVKKLKEHNIVTKINSIIIPGINDKHIPEIAKKMAELKADIFNCMPLLPVKDTEFAGIPEPSKEMTRALRAECEKYLPQMSHCARCRADSVGLLGQDKHRELMEKILKTPSENSASRVIVKLNKEKPFIAVASMEGVLVNQHLGEAVNVHIFEENEEGVNWKEIRTLPLPGGGSARWLKVAKILQDCSALFVGGIGESPKKIMAAAGLPVYEADGVIIELLTKIFKKENIKGLLKKKITACGVNCNGNKAGCG